MEAKYHEGLNRGYLHGTTDGEKTGYDNGKAEGVKEGFVQGANKKEEDIFRSIAKNNCLRKAFIWNTIAWIVMTLLVSLSVLIIFKVIPLPIIDDNMRFILTPLMTGIGVLGKILIPKLAKQDENKEYNKVKKKYSKS